MRSDTSSAIGLSQLVAAKHRSPERVSHSVPSGQGSLHVSMAPSQDLPQKLLMDGSDDVAASSSTTLLSAFSSLSSGSLSLQPVKP